jgi:uncharacterized membrane protein (UPF0127 family)
MKLPARLLSIIFLFTFLAAGCNRQADFTPPVQNQIYNYSRQLQIGSQTLNVEIADTPAKQQQGLSGKKFMDDDQGMLFDFGSVQSPAFWMKDMSFNLDFVWIANGKVVGITPDVSHPNSPADPLPTYNPPLPVNQVLEVNAGWGKKNNIKTGDEVRLEN